MRRELDFHNGTIACDNAAESTFGTLVCPHCVPTHGRIFIAMRVEPEEAPARALYASFTPDQARRIATDLLAWADELDSADTRQ